MVTLDIRGTVVGDPATAIKAPCLVATTGSNITLAGAQTIDGTIVGNASERVLVKDQNNKAQNGIYVASTGNWVLAADFANNNNVAFGTLVLVAGGNTNAGLLFEQTCTDNPIAIGTSLIAFQSQSIAATAPQSASSSSTNTIGTGTQSFTVQPNKSFLAGQWVLIQETSNASNQMLGQVSSYSGNSLTVSVAAIGGSGTYSDWTIVLTNSPAAAGYQPPVGSGNVTGPGAATTGHVATFANLTGKVLQDGGALGSLAGLSSVSAQYLVPSAVALGATMLNGTLNASSALSALTFTVQTLAGNTPSPSDPVWFFFRSGTAANGAISVIEISSALSITIPSGSTLGFSNSTPGRIWIVAANNGGTLSLAAINCLSGTSIYPLGSWSIANVTALAGGSNNALVFYGPASLSNVAYSIIGYGSYEAGSTLSTAGTWSAAPTRIETYRPGVPLPGQEVQRLRTQTGAETVGSTTFSIANSIPTNTSGDQYMSQAVTPSSSANLLEIEAAAMFATAASARSSAALFQDSVANALAATVMTTSGRIEGGVSRRVSSLPEPPERSDTPCREIPPSSRFVSLKRSTIHLPKLPVKAPAECWPRC